MEGVNRRVIMEFIGALALIIILGLVVAWFLGEGMMDCMGDEECMEAREELQRLVNDVNQACQESDIDEVTNEELDHYDFGATHALAIGHTSEGVIPDPTSIRQNEFVITNYDTDDLGLSDVDDFASADFGELVDWKVRITADQCDEIQQCFTNEELYVERWNCEEGPFTSWIFPVLGGSSGEIRYSSFHRDGSPLVKLRYIGDNSPERWVRDALDSIRESLAGFIDDLSDVSISDFPGLSSLSDFIGGGDDDGDDDTYQDRREDAEGVPQDEEDPDGQCTGTPDVSCLDIDDGDTCEALGCRFQRGECFNGDAPEEDSCEELMGLEDTNEEREELCESIDGCDWEDG